MTFGLFLLAVAPICAIIWYFYHKDKYEHEPWSFLFFAYFLGWVCAAVVPFISGKFQSLPENFSGTQMEIFLQAFIIIAFIEEFVKFICLRFVLFRFKTFNEPLDGIIYGVMIGMGFATLENLYFVIDGGWQIAVLRMFTAIPAHGLFGVIMGYYVGKAKFTASKNLKYSFLALLVTVVLHGLYNYALLQDKFPYLGIVTIVGLLFSIPFVRKMIKELQEQSPFKNNSDEKY